MKTLITAAIAIASVNKELKEERGQSEAA